MKVVKPGFLLLLHAFALAIVVNGYSRGLRRACNFPGGMIHLTDQGIIGSYLGEAYLIADGVNVVDKFDGARWASAKATLARFKNQPYGHKGFVSSGNPLTLDRSILQYGPKNSLEVYSLPQTSYSYFPILVHRFVSATLQLAKVQIPTSGQDSSHLTSDVFELYSFRVVLLLDDLKLALSPSLTIEELDQVSETLLASIGYKMNKRDPLLGICLVGTSNDKQTTLFKLGADSSCPDGFVLGGPRTNSVTNWQESSSC